MRRFSYFVAPKVFNPRALKWDIVHVCDTNNVEDTIKNEAYPFYHFYRVLLINLYFFQKMKKFENGYFNIFALSPKL